MTRSLRAPALPASLDDVQDLLQEVWTGNADITLSDRVRFESAVVEIAANIINHGRAAPRCPVVTLHIDLGCDERVLRAAFADDGQPADVNLAVVVMPADDAEGGRGLALAAAVSDLLDYRRDGALNRWTVECLRESPSGRGRTGGGGAGR
jgi:serine/threonine-protein kinase RsbW